MKKKYDIKLQICKDILNEQEHRITNPVTQEWKVVGGIGSLPALLLMSCGRPTGIYLNLFEAQAVAQRYLDTEGE